MGQRLVVRILGIDGRKNEFDPYVGINDAEPIACVYYHWSAYTVDALRTLRDIVAHTRDAKSDKELITLLANHLNETGGGMSDDVELAWLKKNCPDAAYDNYDNRHNSDGLMAVTHAGMLDLEDISDGDAYVDLLTERCGEWVTCSYEGNYCEIKAELEEYGFETPMPATIDDLPVFPDSSDIPFGDNPCKNLDTIIDKYTHYYEQGYYMFRIKGTDEVAMFVA